MLVMVSPATPKPPQSHSTSPALAQTSSIRVQFTLSIRRLWAVDSSSQTFCAALTCFTYHESHGDDVVNIEQDGDEREEGLQLVNGDRAWTSSHFVPQLSVASATEQEWGAWQFMLSPERGPNGRRMLLGKNDAVATIQHGMPLNTFPFDVQGLEVTVALDEDPTIAHLVPMRPPQSDGSPDVVDIAYDEIHFSDINFIEELPHAQGIRTIRTLPPRTGAGRLQGAMASTQAYACVPVVRASAYYLGSAGAVLLVISLCVCSTFVVPVASPGVRLGVDLGLLLIAVSVKGYLAHSLPRATCVTRLDRLTLGVFVLMLAVMCAHALVFLVNALSSPSSRSALLLDSISWAGIVVGWVIYVVMWLLACRHESHAQHLNMRARLRKLQKQHGTEIDDTDSVGWPGATTPGLRRGGGADFLRKGSPWRPSYGSPVAHSARALSMV